MRIKLFITDQLGFLLSHLSITQVICQAAPCAFAAGRAATYRTFEVINCTPVVDASTRKGKALDTLKGEIELCNIQYTYLT
jgi:ABC-type multidrug transport system fused ATPase/permease subunit